MKNYLQKTSIFLIVFCFVLLSSCRETVKEEAHTDDHMETNDHMEMDHGDEHMSDDAEHMDNDTDHMDDDTKHIDEDHMDGVQHD